MMASTGYDVHPRVLVPCSSEVVYGGYPTHWIHLVMLPVLRAILSGARAEDTEGHVQMNDM